MPALKKYVLRRRVRIRDVSQEWDVWAAWGAEEDAAWETQRRWLHAGSGAIEPVWDSEDSAPWGVEPGVLRDRRAIGMGHRLLVRKGDRRECLGCLCVSNVLKAAQHYRHPLMTWPRKTITWCTELCMVCQKACRISCQCMHSQWSLIST